MVNDVDLALVELKLMGYHLISVRAFKDTGYNIWFQPLGSSLWDNTEMFKETLCNGPCTDENIMFSIEKMKAYIIKQEENHD
jgi:hypothetical protein